MDKKRRVLHIATVVVLVLFGLSLFLPGEYSTNKLKLWLFIVSGICAMVLVGSKISRPAVYRDPPGAHGPTAGVHKRKMSKAKVTRFLVFAGGVIALITAELHEKGVFEEADAGIIGIVCIVLALVALVAYFYVRDLPGDLD